MTTAQAILLIGLGLVATYLTMIMFRMRERMLGFPCGIFWAIFAGDCYILSTKDWTDILYLTFFGSIGMFIFVVFAAFALKQRDLEPKKSDWEDVARFADEEKDDGLPKESNAYADGSKADTSNDDFSAPRPNQRTRELHDRADKRRSGIMTKIKWGEFK